MSYSEKIVDGDIVRNISNTGYELISDKDKCIQEIKMVLSTDIRKNGIGGSLDEAIGEDVDNVAGLFSKSPFMFDFQMRVKSALDRLKRAQKSYQFSQKTIKELISEFSPVKMWEIVDDPRNFKWEVDVLTVDGKSNNIGGRTRF